MGKAPSQPRQVSTLQELCHCSCPSLLRDMGKETSSLTIEMCFQLLASSIEKAKLSETHSPTTDHESQQSNHPEIECDDSVSGSVPGNGCPLQIQLAFSFLLQLLLASIHSKSLARPDGFNCQSATKHVDGNPGG